MSFYVQIRKECSAIYNIKAGVLQGSALGPVPHTIYMLDLPQISEVNLALFADNIYITATNANTALASYHLQNQHNSMESWLKNGDHA